MFALDQGGPALTVLSLASRALVPGPERRIVIDSLFQRMDLQARLLGEMMERRAAGPAAKGGRPAQDSATKASTILPSRSTTQVMRGMRTS